MKEVSFEQNLKSYADSERSREKLNQINVALS